MAILSLYFSFQITLQINICLTMLLDGATTWLSCFKFFVSSILIFLIGPRFLYAITSTWLYIQPYWEASGSHVVPSSTSLRFVFPHEKILGSGEIWTSLAKSMHQTWRVNPQDHGALAIGLGFLFRILRILKLMKLFIWDGFFSNIVHM